jgi:hypothetical protein
MSATIDGDAPLGAWERSLFAMTVEELEIHEALTAISRLLEGSHIGPAARRALSVAVEALRAETGPDS